MTFELRRVTDKYPCRDPLCPLAAALWRRVAVNPQIGKVAVEDNRHNA